VSPRSDNGNLPPPGTSVADAAWGTGTIAAPARLTVEVPEMKIRALIRLLLPALAIGAALALLSTAASPAAAQDSGRKLSTVLTGAAEVGGGDPDGTGTAALRVNPGTGQICYTITVANLDPVIAAHIHNAPAGVNGPIVVPLSAPTSGSVTDCTTADPALARDIVLNPDDYYVNVHTTAFPAGAVRGQL